MGYARGGIRTHELLREWILSPSPLTWLGYPRSISEFGHNGGCVAVAHLAMPTNDIGIPHHDTFVAIRKKAVVYHKRPYRISSSRVSLTRDSDSAVDNSGQFAAERAFPEETHRFLLQQRQNVGSGYSGLFLPSSRYFSMEYSTISLACFAFFQSLALAHLCSSSRLYVSKNS